MPGSQTDYAEVDLASQKVSCNTFHKVGVVVVGIVGNNVMQSSNADMWDLKHDYGHIEHV